MNRAVESLGDGFPRLDLVWPGRPLRAGITLRGAAAGSDAHRDPALESLRAWAAGRFHGLVGGTQVHGSRIYDTEDVRVPEPTPDESPFLLRMGRYDGFLARRPGTLLTVGVADCVPALLYAPGAETVALVHAGWRGIAAGIVPEALARMEEMGIRPETVLAWWGPAVSPCCYPVGEEVVEAIRSSVAGPATDGWVHDSPAGPRVDLREALSRQAEARGVSRSSISVSPYCTSCAAELFFSHRREPSAGRMLAFAGVPLPER